MFFCGQCGFQVAPGVTRCPRCGAAVNTGNAGQSGEWHGDDQTVASPSFSPSQSGLQPQRGSGMYPESDDYGAPTVFGSATRMDTPAYPGYNTPPGGQNYPTTMGGQPFQGQNYQGQFQSDQAARSRGRTTGLVLILIGVLMILFAVALYVLTRGGATGSTPGTTSQALMMNINALIW